MYFVKQQLVTNPQASIRRIEAQTGLKRSSVQVMMKKDLLMMKPYRPHLFQALNAADPAKRVKWAEDLLKSVDLDLSFPDYILWRDEAIFHLDGTVNRHNAATWATQNPHVYIEKANQKKASVMVWVGLIKDHIIGLFFFIGSVTGDSYLDLLQTQKLCTIRTVMDDEDKFVIFQQDVVSQLSTMSHVFPPCICIVEMYVSGSEHKVFISYMYLAKCAWHNGWVE